MSLVVVGAHALDPELMAGPLAAVASGAGWPVALVHLTLGERGHPEKPPEVFGPQLREESLRAARALGVEAVWSGAPAPLRGADVFDWLVAELDQRRPTVVVTHWSGSWHASHREANDVVRRAMAALASRPTLAFGENCEDLVGFVPTHLIPVASVRERWLEAASEYELFRHRVLTRNRRKSARKPKGSRQAHRGYLCQIEVTSSSVTAGHRGEPENTPVATRQELDNRNTTCIVSLTPRDRVVAGLVDKGG